MLKNGNKDVNKFWDRVKFKYPDARFEHWFWDGELHFWPDGESEKKRKNLGSCYQDDKGQYAIDIGDDWK